MLRLQHLKRILLRRKKERIVILLTFLLLIINLPTVKTENTLNREKHNKCKISNVYPNIKTENNAELSILSDEDFVSHGFFGDGSQDNPF